MSIGLDKLSFPVFKVGNEPIVEGGVTFFIQSGVDINYDSYKLRIVDDKNIKQPTLAKRRLLLKEQGAPLASLGKAVFFIGDLIKLANSKTWFIDSSGVLFNYTKSKYVPLECFKIDNVIPIPSGGAIICANGSRYKTLYAPRASDQYVGLLKLGIGYILYGVFEEPFAKTKRMI